MKAEEFIELIEQKRFDKISRNGMDLIAKEFRKLQSKPLIIDPVSERYSKDDVRKYGDEWKITTWDEGQKRRRIIAEGYKR